MIKEVVNLVRQNNNDISITEKQIIFTYLKNKCIFFENNTLLVKYLGDITKSEDCGQFEKICKNIQLNNINDLLKATSKNPIFRKPQSHNKAIFRACI